MVAVGHALCRFLSHITPAGAGSSSSAPPPGCQMPSNSQRIANLEGLNRVLRSRNSEVEQELTEKRGRLSQMRTAGFSRESLVREGRKPLCFGRVDVTFFVLLVMQPFQGCPRALRLTQGSSRTRNPGLSDGIPLGFNHGRFTRNAKGDRTPRRREALQPEQANEASALALEPAAGCTM